MAGTSAASISSEPSAAVWTAAGRPAASVARNPEALPPGSLSEGIRTDPERAHEAPL